MLERAQELLRKYYGYPAFKAGQAKVITSILQGNDTLAIMPTGAGKSVCFQIPALSFTGVTLVISPLISLMKDQVDGLNSLGIAATFINSSLDSAEAARRIGKAGRGAYKLLYVAPERLETERFCRLIETLEVSFVAIDEAHCVSQWGHDFRPSYRAIAPFINGLPRRPVIGAFTATATEEIKRDIVNLLTLTAPNIYVTGFNRENLSLEVARGVNKKDFVLKYVKANQGRSGIIYAATRKEVDNLYDFLQAHGYLCGKYHAGLSEAERKNNHEAFIHDDKPVMVATNAFGMGIDKSNVRYVLHYNMPKNMEAYYQEAGRAGRDGERSECILLFAPQDILLQKYLIEQTTLSPDRKANEYKKLQAVVDYCHTPRCLRKYILEYFGEEDVPAECGNCGNCNDDSEMTDITIEAQKIFSCIIRTRERYGAALIAEVLKGSKNKKVLQLGFDRLSTYGLLQGYTLQEIRDLINLLIAEDYLGLTEGEYPVVKLGQKGLAVLRNREKVWQKRPDRKPEAPVDSSLFEALRKLRKEIAGREKVPPYVVFADSTLRELSECRPTDERAMLSVKGVGEIKFSRYGAEFLQVIRQYVIGQGEEQPRDDPGENVIPDNAADVPSHVVSLHMYREGASLAEIAQKRNLKVVTVQDHLVRCGLEGYDVQWDSLIPPQYEELILAKAGQLGTGKLKPLKEALPDEVDYIAIKAVLCKHKLISKGRNPLEKVVL